MEGIVGLKLDGTIGNRLAAEMDNDSIYTLIFCGSIIMNTVLLIRLMNKTDQIDTIVNELEWRVGDLENSVETPKSDPHDY